MVTKKKKNLNFRIQKFLEIFRKIEEKFGMNQSEIARAIQISPSSISHYLSRIYNPSAKVILKMKKLLADLDEENHIIGGNKFQTFSSQRGYRQIPVVHEKDFPKGGRLPDFSNWDRFKTVPVSRTQDEKAFFLVAAWDSVVGTFIQKGDYLLVEPGKPVKPQDLVLCNHPHFSLLVGKYCHSFENTAAILPLKRGCEFTFLTEKEIREIPLYRIGYIEREL